MVYIPIIYIFTYFFRSDLMILSIQLSKYIYNSQNLLTYGL